jgi:hypothetical protein
MSQRVVTVTEVRDGHVALDIQCPDRIYLNCYVPKLQTSAQVVAFLSDHLGYPFPSPALFRKLGEGFRKAVASFAAEHHIPVVRFGKDDVGSKLDVMRPYLDRQASTGYSGVAAIGVAQEFQRVWTAYERQTSTGTPQWWFTKDDRRVSCYYFYLYDLDFGPAFVKICTYFPYPAKIWINGHEWAKRQASHAGIGFTELSNGFAATAGCANHTFILLAIYIASNGYMLTRDRHHHPYADPSVGPSTSCGSTGQDHLVGNPRSHVSRGPSLSIPFSPGSPKTAATSQTRKAAAQRSSRVQRRWPRPG